MKYLLDSDVFIRAKKDHYRFVVCPGFWDWLLHPSQSGVICSIEKVRDELKGGTDDLAIWAAAQSPAFFIPADAGVVAAAATVSAWANGQAYEPHVVAHFLAGADYWLVSHALAGGWTVVTHEQSHPRSKTRIMIPDACAGVSVACMGPFQMLEDEGACFTI